MAEDTGRTGWGVVAVAVAGGIVAALHIGKVPPAIPELRADLGLSLVQSGFVVSLFSLLGMSLGTLFGALSDRLGRRRLVTLGFLSLAAGGALGALSHSLALLLVGRFLEGVGFIAVATTLPAVIVAAALPRHRSTALSFWTIYTPTGMALALVAAPAVLAALDWRALWWGGVALSAVTGLAVRVAMGRVALPPRPAGRAGPAILESLARPGLWLIALTFAAYAFQWVGLMVWLPTFLEEALGLAGAGAAYATALVVLANLVGIFGSGWTMRRTGTGGPWAIPLAALGMALATAAVFLPGLPPLGKVAAAVAFSVVGGFIPGRLFNAVPRHAPGPEHLAAGNGMLLQGSSLGQFACAPLIAWAVSMAGGAWAAALVPMLTAAALTALAGVLLGLRDR